MQGYYQSASTLNLLRAFTKGGFADLTQVHTWNQEFVASSAAGQRYEQLASEIGRALRVHAGDAGSTSRASARSTRSTCGRATRASCSTTRSRSTRKDSLTGDWYDCSAHMLWIGERTRELDGAHVEFFSGVHNPIGVKLGPTATPDDAVRAVRAPQPAPGPRAG